MRITVTPETLRSNASSIRTQKATFEQVIAQMRAIVNGMSGEFEGQAATAYISNFDSYSSQFTAFGELIESFATKLETTATTMEETDASLASVNGQ